MMVQQTLSSLSEPSAIFPFRQTPISLPMIAIQNLSQAFPQQYVLNGIDLTVEKVCSPRILSSAWQIGRLIYLELPHYH